MNIARQMENGRTGGIQVIARAAAILRALRDNRAGMSLGEIAAEVDLPRSTVQRIVGALQAEGFASTSEGRGSIRLGPEMRSMALDSKPDIKDVCRPVLEAVSEQTGETVDLSRLQNEAMVFLDQVQGNHRLRAVSAVGDRFPLSTTANGLAALACLPDDTLLSLYEAEAKTSAESLDMKGFLDTINTIRSSGLAYDLGRHTSGISAIGFAFEDWSGKIHSISVPMPSSRYESRREIVEAALLEAWAELAIALKR